MYARSTAAVHCQPHAEERHSDAGVAAQPHATSSSTFQLLSLLPPPLLASVACHLDVASLLRLHRCCSTLHRFSADASYMVLAWRWAKLRISVSKRLHDWTVPYEQCIAGSAPHEQRFIPESLWQVALPVFHAVVTRPKRCKDNERRRRFHHMVQHEQPTMRILASQTKDGSWEEVDEDNTEQSAAVLHVEVLRDMDWRQLDAALPYSDHVHVLCGLMLRACPYLQHLHLLGCSLVRRAPLCADTFALVPRLRSLCLERCDSDEINRSTFVHLPAMLHSLPCLTSLHCINIQQFSSADLLDIASHSTLEELHIHNEHQSFRLFGEEEDDEELLSDQTTFHLKHDGPIEDVDMVAVEAALAAFMGGGSTSSRQLKVRRMQQRMCAALARTQPSQRSCEVRLALADWLHRRLRRGGLLTDDHARYPSPHNAVVRRFYLLLSLLRCTLHQQLSEMDR